MGERINMKQAKASHNYLAVWNASGEDSLMNAEVIFCGRKEVVASAIIDFCTTEEHEEDDIEQYLKVFRVGSSEKLKVQVVTEPQYTIDF